MKTVNELEINHVSITDKVYNRITDSILNNEFKAGERIVAEKIAKIFKVSRTPIREAFVRLEKDGFIYSVPRSGTFVCKFTEEDIKEIYEVREVLEGLAARFASKNPDMDALKEMSDACESYKLGIDREDIDLCLSNDVRFHRSLVKAGNSKRLIEMLKSYHIQGISIAKKGKNYWKYAPMYLEDHFNVIKFITEGKGILAEKKIRDHIEKGKKRVL